MEMGKNRKFVDICPQSIRYLRKNYGTNLKVVFDGYNIELVDFNRLFICKIHILQIQLKKSRHPQK